MNTDKQKQSPAEVDQIEKQKPNIPRTLSLLTGDIANSMNGGHNRTIAYKKVMAGEKHREYRMNLNIQMLTPLTPAYQKLKCCIKTYYVPNSRVWTNAEKYTAQKGGSSVQKILEIPNFAGKKVPVVYADDNTTASSIMHTTAWRNAFVSSYIPRIGFNITQEISGTNDTTNIAKVTNIMPGASALPLRGRIAIYNDFERNKEYAAEIQEYKTDTVSDAEWESYMPTGILGNSITKNLDTINMRARRQNSYYTDYRTDYQGFESEIPNNDSIGEDASLVTWANWESKIAEARAEAENAQANDWDIIAKIRGSKKLTEGKVQLIGQKTFDINYSAITQNAYNSNSDIRPEFQVMGKQGAYSYTSVDIPCYAGFEAVEEGYIHIIACVYAETVFESAFDRNELNITPLDEYRPELVGEKFDIMYEAENGTTRSVANQNYYQALGFKRKFNEYFKLPNIIAGDMTNLYYQEVEVDTLNYATNGETVITQKSYQFYETDRYYEANSEGETVTANKKIYLDYTDYMINKNQAIQNDIEEVETIIGTLPGRIKGNHQIYLVGKCYLVADLPIDESIKHNFTTWGEH